MHTSRFLEALLAAGVGTLFTDWLFFGVLFHDKNNTYPEVWRPRQGGEIGKVAWSTLLTLFTCAMFIHACDHFDLHTLHYKFAFAMAIWLVACIPMIVTDGIWIKLHPLVSVAHALGWLAKLLVAVFAAQWLLG
jgi:hypothetical protein